MAVAPLAGPAVAAAALLGGSTMTGVGATAVIHPVVRDVIGGERMTGEEYFKDIAINGVVGAVTGGIGAGGGSVATALVGTAAKESLKKGAVMLTCRAATGAVSGAAAGLIQETVNFCTTDASFSFGNIGKSIALEAGLFLRLKTFPKCQPATILFPPSVSGIHHFKDFYWACRDEKGGGGRFLSHRQLFFCLTKTPSVIGLLRKALRAGRYRRNGTCLHAAAEKVTGVARTVTKVAMDAASAGLIDAASQKITEGQVDLTRLAVNVGARAATSAGFEAATMRLWFWGKMGGQIGAGESSRTLNLSRTYNSWVLRGN